MSKKHALLVLAAIAATSLVPVGASAAAPGALEIRDDTPTLSGFAAVDVLYDPTGFAVQGIVGRPGINYVGYGVAGNQVRVSTSADGETWTAPQAATLRDPNGQDAPLVIGNQSRLAVAYVNANILPHNYKFVMVYAPQGGNPRGSSESLLYGQGYDELSNLRYAISPNGVEWFDDQPVISDSSTEGVIKPGTFREGVLVTDLVYNTGGDCYDTVTDFALDWGTGSPFTCEFTLVYTAIDAAGDTSVALAGGIFFIDVGLMFRGATVPALSRSDATWTSSGIDRAHVIRQGSSFAMGVSGSAISQTCVANADRCSVGTAASATGNTFTPEQPSAASITSTQAEALVGAAPRSITDLQLDNGADDERWLLGLDGKTFDAFEPIDVTSAPRVTFYKPRSGFVSAEEPVITFVINDDGTTGGGIGIDLANTEFTIDGAPLTSGFSLGDTPLGQITRPGLLVSIPAAPLGLPDGMHTLGVTAVDLDGETVTASRAIIFDLLTPSSAITTDRSSGFAFPFNSNFVEGSGQDAGTPTGLRFMRATVINPLGQQKNFVEGPGETGNPQAGFSFRNLGPRVPNGGPITWEYTWAAPSNDALFWAIPGIYRVEITAIDFAGNTEGATGANSRSYLLI